MSQTPPAAPVAPPGNTPKPLPVLPDEKFWQHYSPNHEFPLSGVISVALHIVLLALLFFIGIKYLIAQELKAQPKANVAPKETEEPVRIRVAGNDDSGDAARSGGGGGSPNGEGDNPNTGGTEDVGPIHQDPNKKPPNVERPDLPEGIDSPGHGKPPFKGNPNLTELVKSGNETAAMAERLKQDLQDKTRRERRSGKGDGGLGSGGGKGDGRGPGEGDGTGPGKGGRSQHEARNDRWNLHFTFNDGENYLKQLTALGAVVAVQDLEDQSRFRVVFLVPTIREKTLSLKEVAALGKVFFVDEKPDTIAPLARVLGLKPVPTRLIQVYPPEIEAKLLKAELDFAGRHEDDIEETIFEVKPVGPNRYEPRVISQKGR